MSDVIFDSKQSDRAFYGAIERYLTPATTPTTYRCRRVRIPDDLRFVAALNELISRLGFPEMYLETPGGMTPDECAALGSQLFYDYAESDGYCMIGEVKAVALATLPGHLLECDGATYNRVDYPDLYALLDPALIVDANQFTVPDLRGIAVIGAGLYNPGAVTYAVNDLVGARRHTLETAEMPAHSHTSDPHGHTASPHTHVQNAHTHLQDAHNHTQAAHGHSQLGHSHTTPPHTHAVTDPQHSHGFNHLHAIEARANSAAGSSAELMRSSGAGTDSNINTGVPSIGSSTGNASTGITLGNASPTTADATALIQDATATNNAATATNQNTAAVNQSATVNIGNGVALINSTGGSQPHNNMQPSRALKMVIVAR